MLRGKPYISLLLNSFNKEWVLNCVTWFSGISENDDIILISSDGTIIRISVKDVSVLGRNTQGVTLMRMPENVQLVSIAKVTEEETEE